MANKINKNKSNQLPRLTVFRSNRYVYCQLVDDKTGHCLASSSSLKSKSGSNIDAANKVGEKIANLAKDKKIDRIVFDRGKYKYHGKVKALAESARKAGLKF